MMNSTPGTNRPVWDAEKTHPDLVKELKESLRDVIDPELGLDVIQLGLIRNVTVDDRGVILQMILTTPFCPYGPAMIETTRKKAESAVSMPVGIDLSMDAWDFSMMEEGLGSEWGLF
jgi:metal-sulfur cluster biosynthetic enzyme